MKDTVKTSRTAGYLEKIFRALNAKYFNNELEEPIITIQSTPKAYAHVTVAKAWQRGDTTRRELNIGAGTLDRSILRLSHQNSTSAYIFTICKMVYRIAAGAAHTTTKIQSGRRSPRPENRLRPAHRLEYHRADRSPLRICH